MEKTEETKIKTILAKGKYKEANKILNDYLLKNKNDEAAWYLLGVIAMRMKNYELAHEHFERSVSIKKSCDALLFDGLAYLEMLETEPAKRRFFSCLELEPNNQEANFYLAVCYLLEGNPLSATYIRKAYKADKSKTISMLKEFFHEVIEKNPVYPENEKEEIRGTLQKRA